MRKRYVNIVLGGSAAIFFIVLLWWITSDPTRDLQASMPGSDNRGAKTLVEQIVNIGEKFQVFKNIITGTSENWTRFRGEDVDNISKSKTKLKDTWQADEPSVLWSVELGEGHAGAAIYGGKVYILDYIEDKREDALRCFSLETGEELWQRSYNVNLKRNHGMSRTVPAVNEKYILTMGPKCHVMCVERETGDLVWGLDLVKKYNTEVPFWYTGQCPLIDGNKAILAPGNDALMIAVNMDSGEILWETPNPKAWKMSHSSVIPTTLFGKKMYLYSAVGGVCGISAEGSDEGKILWESTAWNHSVVAPSPVAFPDGKIFLTAGYGAGSMMIQVRKTGNSYTTEVLKEYLPKDGLACEQQTPVIWEGHLLGILPKDAGANRNQLVCVHPDDVTKIVWSSGKTTRFGLGPYLIADNKLFVLSDDGTLTMIKPDTKNYRQLAQKKIFDGHDSWAPLAIADGKMILRDSKTMFCIDLKK
ncbi:MAG: hypothetical protein A2W90_04155 [Bacteroidetes bacterium GWF2_42_66]|nr:MAG: hypothetical protein A2W92_06970 [Bacteroidetes bacterium GWA2_42_15]OFY02487.1 MAG: hypothetical protein A2W89_21700 [Bacteroidetes bacterium GWE2_42_39]OFY41415.1 MAG: hypothetical protein A2W90_04155 [Bacteroidetes bacterium GWF2_42_66]HBL75380.1 hypothetical protein [Prolixibacteraceae bacterium]HCR90300.1 hypothetical protein [Prolixibacteraceae bacterium]